MCVAPTEKAIDRYGADTCVTTANAIAGDLIAAGYANAFADPRYRKPAPGMLEAVKADNPGVPLIYVGDMVTDQQAAEAAHTKFMSGRAITSKSKLHQHVSHLCRRQRLDTRLCAAR